MEPEAAHDMAIRSMRMAQLVRAPLGLLSRCYRVDDDRLSQEIWNQRFINPVGLAAGFDKNGQVLEVLQALGFGFLEAGTVTPMPQRGNPRPRMFRFPEQQSLQNSLGFNNLGVEEISRRLGSRKKISVPVGVNIGKNRTTPGERAIDDYVLLVERLQDRCSYFVVNISSPNTPGLRDLQEKDTVVELLSKCAEKTTKPLLLKLAPDLDDQATVELSLAAVEAGASGIILTNTTIDYSLLEGASPVGGLSGRVLRQKSYELLQVVAAELFDRCVLISVGGIDSANEAIKRLRAGASLVQIYTGMVYRGPGLISEIVRGIAKHLDDCGASRVQEIIGRDLV
jgi:dihydroorotate dehydrogenase